jgi:hypothetical protein
MKYHSLDRCYRAFLFLLLSTYMDTTNAIVSVFACDSSGYLRQSPSLLCSSSRAVNARIAAGICLGLWTIGIPLVLGLLMRRTYMARAAHVGNDRNSVAVAFVAGGYKPTTWYYEGVMIGNLFLLCCFRALRV